MLYEQAAPVKYKSGKGEFAGYWVTFQFDANFPTQSAMGWTSYSCQTGYPFGEHTHIDNFEGAMNLMLIHSADLVKFRTAAINNATSTFQKEGKQSGKLLGPLSEQLCSE